MNWLTELVETARETIAKGYYKNHGQIKPGPSLRAAIGKATADGRLAIIAEVKPASPSRGRIAEGGVEGLIERYAADGATGISVLTEPTHFGGNLRYLRRAVATGLPVLMKDFILDERQIDCAADIGAGAILLIASILPKRRLGDLIDYAHTAEREVLLEVANEKQYVHSLETEADLIGINNRDLKTFEVDIERTARIRASAEADRPIVSLSGYQTSEQIQRMRSHADAFLVGSSLVDGTTTIGDLLNT